MRPNDVKRALEELEGAYCAGLEGRQLRVGEEDGVIVEYERHSAFVTYQTSEGETRRLRATKVLPALVSWQCKHGRVCKGKKVPEGINELALMLHRVAQRLRELKDVIATWRRKRKAHRATIDHKRRKTMHDVGDHTTQLKSFDRQSSYLDTREKLQEDVAKLVESHELHDMLAPFQTLRGTVQHFISVFGVPLSKTSLVRRLRGPVRENMGPPTLLSKAQEEELAEHVVRMAKRGKVCVHEEVRRLAAEMMEGCQDGTAEIASMSWYKSWLKRMAPKYELRNVSISTLPKECLKNYHSACISWWYTVTKARLLELGVAKQCGDNQEGELEWLFPHRVLVLDETHVVSRESSQSKKTRMRGPAPEYLQRKGDRVRTAQAKDDATHVTLLAGMNLAGQCAPPLWILSSNGPRQKIIEKMSEVSKTYCTSRQLGKFGLRHFPGCELAWSPNGSMTKENFQANILKVLEPIFPDMSDSDPAKRVVLFMDGHSSRQHIPALQKLAGRGVYLHYWLPHTMSQCQAPDKDLFGPLKSAAEKQKARGRKSKGKEESLTQIQQITACAKALIMVAQPQRVLNALRLTGIMPFTRKVHLENPVMQIGDMIHEELTLPLRGTSLLKFIQSPLQTSAVHPIGDLEGAPSSSSARNAHSSSGREANVSPVDVSAEANAFSIFSAAPSPPQVEQSQVEAPISSPELSPSVTHPSPPRASQRGNMASNQSTRTTVTDQALITNESPADSCPTHSTSGQERGMAVATSGAEVSRYPAAVSPSSASSLSSSRSAFPAVQNSFRLTRLHLGDASAFVSTASDAEITAMKEKLRTNFARRIRDMKETKRKNRAVKEEELRSIAQRYDPDQRRHEREQMINDLRVSELAASDALREQARALLARADAKREFLSSKISALEKRAYGEHCLEREKACNEARNRWATREAQLDREQDCLHDFLSSLSGVPSSPSDERERVGRAYEFDSITLHAQRDDFGIARDKISPLDDECSSRSSEVLRLRDEAAVGTPVRAGTDHVSNRPQRTSSLFRRTDSTSGNDDVALRGLQASDSPRVLSASSSSSAGAGAGATVPAPEEGKRLQPQGTSNIDDVVNAKAALEMLLYQATPPIMQSKEALKTLKKALKSAKNPIWRECVLAETKYGREFLSKAARILERLSTT